MMPARLSPVEEEFDRKAAAYDTDRLAPWYQAHGEQILEALDDPCGGLVVDIGCGTGWLLRRIATRFPEAEGLGIDLAGNMVAVAREKARSHTAKLSFIKLDWEDAEKEVFASLRRDSARTVVCASAFHYFADPRGALEKSFRLLAPGGQFLLLERAKDRAWMAAVWDVLHRFLIRDQARFYTSGDLSKMLEDVGFCDVEIRWRLRKFMWNNKFHTSVVLISARKPA